MSGAEVIAKFKALTRFAAFPGIPPEARGREVLCGAASVLGLGV